MILGEHAVFSDGACVFGTCLETGPHGHDICPECGAVKFGNLGCRTCLENMAAAGLSTAVATLLRWDATGHSPAAAALCTPCGGAWRAYRDDIDAPGPHLHMPIFDPDYDRAVRERIDAWWARFLDTLRYLHLPRAIEAPEEGARDATH